MYSDHIAELATAFGKSFDASDAFLWVEPISFLFPKAPTIIDKH